MHGKLVAMCSGLIQDIPEDLNNVTIVQSPVAMAKFLNLPTFAEGVETTRLAEFLHNAGCDVL
jgi:EAL domain-containing protein (putative c-di-GMP-specific phosphodiesterase class I)